MMEKIKLTKNQQKILKKMQIEEKKLVDDFVKLKSALRNDKYNQKLREDAKIATIRLHLFNPVKYGPKVLQELAGDKNHNTFVRWLDPYKKYVQ